MAERLCVVTGASSALGQSLLRRFAVDTSLDVVGLVTGRRQPREHARNIAYLTQDLLAPLSSEVEDHLRRAERIVSLAWVRPGPVSPAEAATANERIADRLLAVAGVGSKLVFLSSVAASPLAISHYGRSKYAVQSRVLEAGGTSIVCGLIVGEPPETAFATLVAMHRRLPIAFRLIPNTVAVYPICRADVIGLVVRLAGMPDARGAYRGFFDGGVPFNEFVDWMLRRYGIRRLRVPLPLAAIHAAIRLAGSGALAEKLGTFFFKDAAALQGLRAPPEASLSETEREFDRLTEH